MTNSVQGLFTNNIEVYTYINYEEQNMNKIISKIRSTINKTNEVDTKDFFTPRELKQLQYPTPKEESKIKIKIVI